MKKVLSLLVCCLIVFLLVSCELPKNKITAPEDTSPVFQPLESGGISIDLGKLLNPKRIKVMQVSEGSYFSSLGPICTSNKRLITPIIDFIDQKFIFELNDDETNRLFELIKEYGKANFHICLNFLNYEGELIQVCVFDNVTHFNYTNLNPNDSGVLPKIKGLYVHTKDFEYVCKDIDSIDLYEFSELVYKYFRNRKWFV